MIKSNNSTIEKDDMMGILTKMLGIMIFFATLPFFENIITWLLVAFAVILSYEKKNKEKSEFEFFAGFLGGLLIVFGISLKEDYNLIGIILILCGIWVFFTYDDGEYSIEKNTGNYAKQIKSKDDVE
ncbi:MAG: hypothetical protein ABIF85_06225 [Nanoarchaeota archaeon]